MLKSSLRRVSVRARARAGNWGGRRSNDGIRRASTAGSNTGRGRLGAGAAAPVLFFLGGSALTYGGLKLAAEKDSGSRSTASTTKLSELGTVEYGTPADFQQAFREIEEIVGKEHVSSSPGDIDTHSDTYYQTHHPLPGQRPALIAYPADTAEVAAVLKVAHRYRVPVVPYSGGTSLEGQFIASRAGLTLDLNRLNKIVQFNAEDLDVTVQPAVGWMELNEFLEPHGLLFGPDPGPGAEIGGMVGTSCSGTNAGRYGTMKENVIGLTVVLADGTIVKTKRRPRKSAAGYNLTGLFVGSEGTLGVVTEATLRLHVRPEDETIAVVAFDSVEDASTSVAEIVSRGIQVNAVELLDTNMMNCINHVKSTSKTWLEKPTLFIKLGGSKPIIKELVHTVEQIAKKNNALQFQFAQSDDEKQELWSARRMGLWSTIDWGKQTIDPDIKVYITDAAVPISKLPLVIKQTQQDITQSGFKSTILGHVGDGNFHFLILYKDSQKTEVQEVVNRLVQRAIDNDGTCTGEHGVGVGKRAYLVSELGPDAVDLMRRLKIALDPQRLLNPDKIFKIDTADLSNH